MNPLIYILPLCFPVMAWVGLALGGGWLLLLPLVAFGAVPLAEIMVPGRGEWIDGEGGERRFQTVCRIDTPVELEYYRNGGILQTVLRRMAS